MSDITNYKYDVVYKLNNSDDELDIIKDVIPKQLPAEKVNDNYGYYLDTINTKVTYDKPVTLRVYRRIGDSTERIKVYEDNKFTFLTFNYRKSFIIDEVDAGEKILVQILNLNDEEHIPLKYSLSKLEYDIDSDREQHVDVYIKKSADSDDSYVRLYQCISASSTGELVKASIQSLEHGVEYTIRIYHYETGQELEFPVTGLYEFKSGNNIYHDDYIIYNTSYKVKYPNVRKEMYSTIVEDNNDMFFPLLRDTKSLLNPNLKLKEYNVTVDNYYAYESALDKPRVIGLMIRDDSYVEFPNDPNDLEHNITYNTFFPTNPNETYVYFMRICLTELADIIPIFSFTHNGVTRSISIKLDTNDNYITTFTGTKAFFVKPVSYGAKKRWNNIMLSANHKGELGSVIISNDDTDVANQTLKGELLYSIQYEDNLYMPIDKASKFTYIRKYYTTATTTTADIEKGIYLRLAYRYYKKGSGNYFVECQADYNYTEPVLLNVSSATSAPQYTTLTLELNPEDHIGDYVLVQISMIGETGQCAFSTSMRFSEAFYVIESDGLKQDMTEKIKLVENSGGIKVARFASRYISVGEESIYIDRFIIGINQIPYPINGLISGDLTCKVSGLSSDASIRIGAPGCKEFAICNVGRRTIYNLPEEDVFLPYDYIPIDMYKEILYGYDNYPSMVGRLKDGTVGIYSKYIQRNYAPIIEDDYIIMNNLYYINSVYDWAYGLYKNKDKLVYKPIIGSYVEDLLSAGFGLHFNVNTKEQFESAVDTFIKLFYTNNIKEHNKLDGGTHGQLVYADFNERCIVIEAHGDKYVGDVPALSSDTYDKGYGLPLNILDVPNSYIGGITKQPTIRVGGAISYYKYTGLGIYSATIKIPKGFNGATVGIRISYNRTVSNAIDNVLYTGLTEGSMGYDYNKVVKTTNIDKVINIDNNVDFTITSNVANVYITKLPTDDNSNWYLPSITQLQTLLAVVNGVRKLYKIDWTKSVIAISNRLAGLTVYEPADPQCYLTTKELFWTYVKDITDSTVSPANAKFRSTVTNNEEYNPINNNISSLSPRFFEMYNNVDTDLVAIINDDNLTTFADDEWHEYKLLIQASNIQLIIDGNLVGYIEKVIPYAPLRFSIGCWFPSIDIDDDQAIARKEYGTYAGAIADWDIKHIKIRDIGYSGEQPNFVEPESIPFDGIRTIKQLN